MATFMTHDLGEQFLVQTAFAPLGTRMEVLEADALYTQTGHGDGEKCLHSSSGTDDPFASVAAGDYLYLAGGTDNEVTAGVYEVASVGGDDENVLLSSDPYAGNVASGIVVLRQYRFAIGLDRRGTLLENHSITSAESFEEDGTSYARQLVCPMDSSNWTIRQESTTLDYEALSAQVTFTAGGTDWHANTTAFLVAFTGTIADPLNEILIASYQFDSSVTLANGESHPFKFYMRFSESS